MIGAVGQIGTSAATPGQSIGRTGDGDEFAQLMSDGSVRDGATRAAAPRGRAAGPADRTANLDDALAAFRKEASLTPAQRARRDVLESMNLTEDAVADMPPEIREATETKIAAEVARRLRAAEAAEGRGTTGRALTLHL